MVAFSSCVIVMTLALGVDICQVPRVSMFLSSLSTIQHDHLTTWCGLRGLLIIEDAAFGGLKRQFPFTSTYYCGGPPQ
jgi:hypothetical protein